MYFVSPGNINNSIRFQVRIQNFGKGGGVWVTANYLNVAFWRACDEVWGPPKRKGGGRGPDPQDAPPPGSAPEIESLQEVII